MKITGHGCSTKTVDELDMDKPTTPQSPQAESTPRWGAWMTFLTAWIHPASTARRTHHVSLLLAGLVHVIALIVAVGILLFVVAYLNYPKPLTLILIKKKFIWLVAEILEQIPLQALPVLPRVLVTLAIVEFAFVGLALLLSPWGARDEPVSASCRHAMRRVWLQTTHLVPIVLLIGGVAVGLTWAEAAWEQTDPAPVFNPPQHPRWLLAPDHPDYNRALTEYPTAYEEYRRAYQTAWRAWHGAKPWYIQDTESVIVAACSAAAVWLLWALLRAVGAYREATPIDRPPKCEACGYNLSGTPMDSVCPECGESVALSLGTVARVGPIWGRRAEVGRWKAWRRCCSDAIFQPKEFGRQIQLTSPDIAHRHFLACHLPLIFCLAVVGFGVFVSLGGSANTVTENPAMVLCSGTVVGSLSVTIAVVQVHLAALLGALWYRPEGDRNLLSGSIQVACYLSGYLVFGVVFATALGSAVITADQYDLFRGPARFLHVDSGDLAFLCWFLSGVFLLVVYFVLVFRGTGSIRYANR